MAVSLTTISNISNQLVPILVNAIDLDKANDLSDVAADKANQMSIPPGSQVRIETQRVDLGQLERLRTFGLISY